MTKINHIRLLKYEIEKISRLIGRGSNENGNLDCGDNVALSRDDLMTISAYRNLVQSSSKKSVGSKLIFCLITTLLSAILFGYLNPIDLVFNANSDSCFWKLPSSMQNLFVPPNRCDFCRNLSMVERRYSLGQDEFRQRYAYSKVPVVVSDAMQNWSAPAQFSFAYFRQIYFEEDRTFSSSNCQFFPYKTEFRSLQEVFQMDPSRANYSAGSRPWYVGWSNCNHYVANRLRRHYTKPYFLPADSESIRTDWIFMGTPDNGAHMHIDHVGRPSWQAQIRGKKRWFLEPPLECYGECHDQLVVDVNQGDLVVLDTNVWYHRTLILDNEISITIGAEYD